MSDIVSKYEFILANIAFFFSSASHGITERLRLEKMSGTHLV